MKNLKVAIIVNHYESFNTFQYLDIMEDVKEECSKFGGVKSIEIPRPRAGQEVTGVGKVYVEFLNLEGCNKGLAHRLHTPIDRRYLAEFIRDNRHKSHSYMRSISLVDLQPYNNSFQFFFNTKNVLLSLISNECVIRTKICGTRCPHIILRS